MSPSPAIKVEMAQEEARGSGAVASSAAAAVGPIPSKYLNSMGFVDYDHFGNFPWKGTVEKVKIPRKMKQVTEVLALDCEMVGISEEFDERELARVSVVNQYGYCIFDSFAKPDAPVVKYHTKWSGVREEDLIHAPGVDEVRRKVRKLVDGKILIGHSIHYDLEVLNMSDYPPHLIRDTADFFRFRLRPGQVKTPGLKQLCERYLQVEIQNDARHGHSSIQDSQAALKLYLLYADLWEREHLRKTEKTHRLATEGALGTFVHSNISKMNVKPQRKDLFVDSSTVSLRKNRIIGPYESSQEYLDIQFRLLLEDFLRPLRDGVQIVNYKNREKYLIDRLFRGVSVKVSSSEAECKEKSGRSFYGNIEIPIDSNHLRNVDWNKTKMFLKGSLVVLSADNFDTVHFGIVDLLNDKSTLPTSEYLVISVRFDKKSNKSYFNQMQPERFCMIESRAYYEAYKHTLEYLKTVDLEEFPMKKYIVDVRTAMVQPKRLVEKVKKGGHQLNFGVLISDNSLSSKLRIKNMLNLSTWPSPEVLGLDESQHLALRQAMTQELSIIQGPPGCGKTFIGVQIVKLLLTNPWLLDNSPIMIVSFTNHALDEILERLFRFYSDYFHGGDDKEAGLGMIRLGGCSESDQIKELTLFKKQDQHNMKHAVQKDLKKAQGNILSLRFLKNLFEKDPWLLQSGVFDLSTLYSQNIPQIHLSNLQSRIKAAGIVKFGLEFWNSKRFKSNPTKELGLKGLSELEREQKLKKFLIPSGNSKLSSILVAKFLSTPLVVCSRGESVVDTFLETKNWKSLPEKELHYVEVWKSYFGIIRCIREYIEYLDRNISDLKSKLKSIGPTRSRKEHIKAAKIIGMTTTGAVKNKALIIKSFQPQVVLVEEAAHVLEAHLVSSLTKFCDQLILIGDHKQLRPLTADNLMAWRYKLDISLMERLVRNGIAKGEQNWVQLKTQHRMREEIAKLVSPLIYKELENHGDVFQYGDVKGCKKNLFFIDHEFPESKEPGDKSYINLYEIEVMTVLARFFVGNGLYCPSKVSIIATYKAQRDKIEARLKQLRNPDLESIRVSTVDGYQGEENDIILLSLVRSNKEERIGFLKTNNRLCVALSRAKHGLFMTGNMKCLSGAAENWETIQETLHDLQSIGTAQELPLYGAGSNNLKHMKKVKKPQPTAVHKPVKKELQYLNPSNSFLPVDEMESVVNKMKKLSVSAEAKSSPAVDQKSKKSVSKLEVSFSKLSLNSNTEVKAKSDKSPKVVAFPQVQINIKKKSAMPIVSPAKKNRCTKVFNCGHTCTLEHVHSSHDVYRCPFICERTCGNGRHKCADQHPCWKHCKLTANTYVCEIPVPHKEVVFACGHKVRSTRHKKCENKPSDEPVRVYELKLSCVDCRGKK